MHMQCARARFHLKSHWCSIRTAGKVMKVVSTSPDTGQLRSAACARCCLPIHRRGWRSGFFFLQIIMRSFFPRRAAIGHACVLACIVAASFPVQAHGDHTHGHGTVRMEADGPLLVAELDMPLQSLLGYDHPPSGSAQLAVLHALRVRLAEPERFISPAAAARCEVTDRQVSPPLTDQGPEIVNLRLRLSYRCEQPGALQSIRFTAFEGHPGLKQLRLNWKGPAGRKTVTVRPRFPAFVF